MFPDINNHSVIALDTETTGLNYPKDKAFGYSLTLSNLESYYWDIRQNPQAAAWLQDSLMNYRGRIVFHNAPFDVAMFKTIGVEVPLRRGYVDDTGVLACLINEHLATRFPWGNRPIGYSLDDLAHKYLGENKDTDLYQKLAEMFGGPATRNAQISRIKDAPVEFVAKYARKDTELTLRLWMWQIEEIENQGIRDIVDFERWVMPTLIRARCRGIRVDTGYAHKAMDELSVIIEREQGKLNKIAGKDINVNSSPQIRDLFEPKLNNEGIWVANDGTELPSTGKGQPSVGADTLRQMKHPAAALIEEIRSTIKTRDTFLKKHVIEHSSDGRVYPHINQTAGEDGGTKTGRLSYTDPALQQIPSRNKEKARIVKPCFLPEEGHWWVDSDLNSFEVRIFGHLVAAYNRAVADAYAKDPLMDLHQFVADLMGIPRNATKVLEANGKQLNLSMIFNSGNGAIADKVGLPWEWSEFDAVEYGRTKRVRYKKAGPEAMALIDKYHQRMPGVKVLADRCKAKAEKVGYVRTRYGRRLRFPGKYKSYKASGLLIQATAADVNKRNWVVIEETLGDDANIILNTHDSYGMSMPEEGWQERYREVKSAVEDIEGMRVPIILDLNGAGRNWWEALDG